MNAALRDYYLLWRMALSIRHARANTILFGFAVFAALCVGALVQLGERELLHTASAAARAAVASLLGGWMMYFVPGAVKLNTPFTARMVPRMRRRLMALTTLVWAIATASATLMSLDTRMVPAFVFLGTGSWIAAYGLGLSGHRAAGVVQCALVFPVVFNSSLPAGLFDSLGTGTGLAVATLLMLALGAFTLQAMFMNGGEKHYAACEARALQSERLSAAGQFRERKERKFGVALYLRVLHRDCRTRDSGRLLGHLLGAQNHWVYRAIMLGGVLAIAACALLGMRLFASADTNQMVAAIGWIFASALLLAPVFDSERRNVRLKDTAAEQALFRLVPAMPGAAPAFNRRVDGALLRGALLEWAMLAGTVLCLSVMTGASAASLFMQACFCCLTLPLVGASLRNHAHRAGLLGWRLFLGAAASIGVSFAAGVALERALGLPLTAGAALASIVIALAVVAGGFARSRTAPFAFPAGRLA
jgi:hypothetical protein